MFPIVLVDTVFPGMRCGIFNLGFLGIRRDPVTATLLAWWRHKVELFGYVDYGGGLFVDQKWMDLACGLFPLTVLAQPGYNVAYWNIAQRPVVAHGGGYRVCGHPLRFIHFSHIDLGTDQRFFRRNAPLGTEPIVALRRGYSRCVRAIREKIRRRDRWS